MIRPFPKPCPGRSPSDGARPLSSSETPRFGMRSVRRMRKTVSVFRPDPDKNETGGWIIRDLKKADDVLDYRMNKLSVSQEYGL